MVRIENIMECFITDIYIKNLRHLKNIHINMDSQKRQHLMITGKNGSGKTSLLQAISKKIDYAPAMYRRLLAYQNAVMKMNKDHKYEVVNPETVENMEFGGKSDISLEYREEPWIGVESELSRGIQIFFNLSRDEKELSRTIAKEMKNGNFIIAFFEAGRVMEMEMPDGAEKVIPNRFYGISDSPEKLFLKYMVHLKTQQAYARNENDQETVEAIQNWFENLQRALKVLLDDESVQLKYDYKEYNFQILEQGRQPIGFDQLSDGYASVIQMVTNLIMRMEHRDDQKMPLFHYDVQGIVLIDEIETHLHIELQKKILPFLTEFFPRIQFIVTTHSPYILNSISNSAVYDLENKIKVEDLSGYSAEGIVEGYFENDLYSDQAKLKLKRYRELLRKEKLSASERAERARLRDELQNIPAELAKEMKDAFEELEAERKLKIHD